VQSWVDEQGATNIRWRPSHSNANSVKTQVKQYMYNLRSELTNWRQNGYISKNRNSSLIIVNNFKVELSFTENFKFLAQKFPDLQFSSPGPKITIQGTP
jgi:hypothetical protein